MLPDHDTVNAFQRDGAVVVRGLFNAQQIALLESGIEQNLNNPSQREKIASRPGDPGKFFEDFCNWQNIDAYDQFIRHSDIGDFAAALMQSKQCRLFHDHLLVKEPGTDQPTPWHQDQPYYNVDGRQNVSMWIPVDSVNRETTLEFVAGSHLGPWLMPRTFMDNQAKWFPAGSLQELQDIEAQRDKLNILGWALEPGDAICFHMLTLHASPGVGGSNRRRAFSVRLLGDDITHAPRRWATSPDFPGLTNEISAGAPMDHALFPILAGSVDP
jgi:ectoine hydroxylase-related dioxygenase (phytanoyl-CoA dioxygenase family)